jgi:hypothetical protein
MKHESGHQITTYDIADAIEYVHEHDTSHGSIHRDHIGFDTRNEVKICGFRSACMATCQHNGTCVNCRPCPSVGTPSCYS